jgi:hypothetical protein
MDHARQTPATVELDFLQIARTGDVLGASTGSSLQLLEQPPCTSRLKIHRLKKIATRTNKSALEAEVAKAIARIADLDRDELVERWRKRFGVEPLKGCGRSLLEMAAAYEIQERAFGGLKPQIRKAHTVDNLGSVDRLSARRAKNRIIKPGTRLVREWNGRTHQVEAVDGGFLWNGMRHRSLSTIAKAITGAHWSGPRFFGI